MSIALYDSDYTRFSRHSLPSYYLMKIASYFKSRHEIVKLITDLQRADLYSKLYYNQDSIVGSDSMEESGPLSLQKFNECARMLQFIQISQSKKLIIGN